jgi:diguanylate cyclase (GGDEF)-like protein/PAS domain S-box-containing protein
MDRTAAMAEHTQMLEDMYQQLLNAAPDAILTTDAEGRVLVANQQAEVIFGYRQDELIGQPVEMLIPAAMRKRHESLRDGYSAQPYSRPMGKFVATVGQRKDGSHLSLDIALSPFKSDEGLLVTAIIRDVSERRQLEQALRESEERFRILYDNNPSMYFTLDGEGVIRSVNRFGAELLGYAPDDLIGKKAAKVLCYEEDIPVLLDHIKTCLAVPDRIHQWELRKVRGDGAIIRVKETAHAVMLGEGESWVLVVSEDITEAHELARIVTYQATHDVVTDLVNRHEFERRLGQVIDAARQGQSEHAFLYLDLDQFKVINDTCGHLAGDELLRQVAALLKANVRQRDTVARLGGDEFGILLERCRATRAYTIANTLRKAIEKNRFAWENNRFGIACSIGLIPIDATVEGLRGVMGMADEACYAAKDEGRNRIHIHQADDVDMVRRRGEMQWVARIHRALDEGLFELYWQKIAPMDVEKSPGYHYELLLRMKDTGGKVVLPGSFLAAAERFSLAAKLDRWVIGRAFDWLAGHPEHLERLHLCAINLSAQSLNDGEFLGFVLEKMGEGHIPPGKICFEITETAAIANLTRATLVIEILRKEGCLFALDDFGSGLSSFAYLKDLPVDFLKIDGAFVKEIAADPVALAMVRSINEIGHVMAKKTIAEFVESEAILRRLRELGVDYAQGYYLGRPQPLVGES